MKYSLSVGTLYEDDYVSFSFGMESPKHYTIIIKINRDKNDDTIFMLPYKLREKVSKLQRKDTKLLLDFLHQTGNHNFMFSEIEDTHPVWRHMRELYAEHPVWNYLELSEECGDEPESDEECLWLEELENMENVKELENVEDVENVEDDEMEAYWENAVAFYQEERCHLCVALDGRRPKNTREHQQTRKHQMQVHQYLALQHMQIATAMNGNGWKDNIRC